MSLVDRQLFFTQISIEPHRKTCPYLSGCCPVFLLSQRRTISVKLFDFGITLVKHQSLSQLVFLEIAISHFLVITYQHNSSTGLNFKSCIILFFLIDLLSVTGSCKTNRYADNTEVVSVSKLDFPDEPETKCNSE